MDTAHAAGAFFAIAHPYFAAGSTYNYSYAEIIDLADRVTGPYEFSLQHNSGNMADSLPLWDEALTGCAAARNIYHVAGDDGHENWGTTDYWTDVWVPGAASADAFIASLLEGRCVVRQKAAAITLPVDFWSLDATTLTVKYAAEDGSKVEFIGAMFGNIAGSVLQTNDGAKGTLTKAEAAEGVTYTLTDDVKYVRVKITDPAGKVVLTNAVKVDSDGLVFMTDTDPYDGMGANGAWYKCNLHSHSAGSDGTASYDAVQFAYAAQGFDLNVVTDHQRFTQQDSGVSSISDSNDWAVIGMNTNDDTPVSTYYPGQGGVLGMGHSGVGVKGNSEDSWGGAFHGKVGLRLSNISPTEPVVDLTNGHHSLVRVWNSSPSGAGIIIKPMSTNCMIPWQVQNSGGTMLVGIDKYGKLVVNMSGLEIGSSSSPAGSTRVTSIIVPKATGTAWAAGQPLYISASGVTLADADAVETVDAIGLAKEPASAGSASGALAKEGILVLADWTAVAGSATLTAGAKYYVAKGDAGKITSVAPGAGVTKMVGVALTTTALWIDCGRTPV